MISRRYASSLSTSLEPWRWPMFCGCCVLLSGLSLALAARPRNPLSINVSVFALRRWGVSDLKTVRQTMYEMTDESAQHLERTRCKETVMIVRESPEGQKVGCRALYDRAHGPRVKWTLYCERDHRWNKVSEFSACLALSDTHLSMIVQDEEVGSE